MDHPFEDNDGIRDSRDPNDRSRYRSSRSRNDLDRDGIRNSRDRDIDGDGVRNSRDRNDYNRRRR